MVYILYNIYSIYSIYRHHPSGANGPFSGRARKNTHQIFPFSFLIDVKPFSTCFRHIFVF